MNRAACLFILFLFSVGECGAAQLSIDECIQRSLQANKGLKAAGYGVSASDERVLASRSAFFPALKLSASATLLDRQGRLIIDRDTFGPSTPAQQVEVATYDRDLYLFSLGVEQPLFTGGRLTHTLRKAEVEQSQASLELDRERETLVHEVRKNYHETMVLRLQRHVAERNEAVKRERLRVLHERNQEGYGRPDDVLRQEADLATAELESGRYRSREEMNLSKLRQLVGLKPDEELELTDPATAVMIQVPLATVTKYAVEHRKDLKLSQSRIQGADEDIALARSAYFPQAALQGKYLRTNESNFNRADIWLVSATLDWTLFEWGKTSAEVREKSATKQRLQSTHAEHEDRVALDAESSWRKIRESELSVKAHEKRVRLFEQLSRLTAERYTEGELRLEELLESETNLVEEFSRYLIALNELDSAVAALDFAASGTPPDWWKRQQVYTPTIEFRSPGLKLTPDVPARPQDKFEQTSGVDIAEKEIEALLSE